MKIKNLKDMVKINILHVIENGIIIKTEVAKGNAAAESIFDNLADTQLQKLGLDIEEEDLSEDYASRLDEVNSILDGFGIEIVWLEDVEVN